MTIQMCDRCGVQGIQKRVTFEARSRDLCDACSASFVRWLGGASRRSGPPERVTGERAA